MYSFVIVGGGFLSVSNSSSFHNTHLSPFTFTRTVCVSSCVALAGYTGRGDAAPPHYPSDRTRHRDNVGGTENGGVKSGAESASRESTRGRRRRPRFSCCAAVQRASDDILILPSFRPNLGSLKRERERGGGVPARPRLPLLSVAVWDSMTDGLEGLEGLDKRKGLRMIKGPKKTTTATVPIAASVGPIVSAEIPISGVSV